MTSDDRGFVHGIDPGPSTGMVLARRIGHGLYPLDATTMVRGSDEGIADHAGTVRLVRRMAAVSMAMLDKHAVADTDVEVFFETMLPARPLKSGTNVVALSVHHDTVQAWAGAGAMAVLWPDAHPVAPKDHDHWPELPTELKGRHPHGWMIDSDARQHQRAAWGTVADGYQRVHGVKPRILTADDVLDVAIADYRASGEVSREALLAAARSALGTGFVPALVDLAVRLAVHENPTGTKPDALRARMVEIVSGAGVRAAVALPKSTGGIR